MFIYIVLPIYIVLFVLFYLRLNSYYNDIKENTHYHKGLLVIIALFVVLSLLGVFMSDSSVKFFLEKYTNIIFGFLLYFVMGIVLLDVIGLFYKKKDKKKYAIISLCISLVFSLSLNIYGTIHAQHITLKNYEMTIHKSSQLDHLKIALIADLHMSMNSTPGLFKDMVDMINENDVDIVLVGGDIFTSSYNALENPEEYIKILSGMKAKYGVYGVYGNHDNEENLLVGFPMTALKDAYRYDNMDEFCKKSGIQILNDEVITIEDIQLVGRQSGQKTGHGDTPRCDMSELMTQVKKDEPLIVLEHEPMDFDSMDKSVDLVLCGHTHDGQLYPGTFITRILNEANYGYVEINHIPTIVTSGVGYYGPPLRVGTNSEVVIVDINFDGKNV